MSSGGLSNTLAVATGCVGVVPRGVVSRGLDSIPLLLGLGLADTGANRSSSSLSGSVFRFSSGFTFRNRSSSMETFMVFDGEVLNIPVFALISFSSCLVMRAGSLMVGRVSGLVRRKEDERDSVLAMSESD